jgi:hypothetical protein
MFATTCRKCQLIRIYLGCAFLAIVMIGLGAEKAQAVAGMMPSPLMIGLLIMLGGSTAFYVRYKAYRAELLAAQLVTQQSAGQRDEIR